MPTMQRERKSPWAAVLILAVLGLPLLYPLSLGPVVWLFNQGVVREESFVLKAYGPIEWAADRSPAFMTIMERYLDIWDGPDVAATIPPNAPLPYVPPPPLPANLAPANIGPAARPDLDFVIPDE